MKIGLLGAENSHTKGFCEAINNEKKYPGYAITHVYGGDSPDACAKLCEKYGLTECASEEEVIELCDALVITYRKGSLHYEAAMKSLKAGKPIFNDKPFTTDIEQSREIAEYAEKNNLLVCGGSTVKNVPEISELASKIEPGSTVVISYGADPESEYDGFWFYGIHSVEVCLKLLGSEYKSVSACRNGQGVVASVNYGDRKCVITTVPNVWEMYISIMSGDRSETIKIPNGDPHIAPDELIEMLDTGKSPRCYSFYVEATKLMSEIVSFF